MSRQGLRPIAITLSLLLAAEGPAQASPIKFADVVAQAVATRASGERQTFDLRLRTLPQNGRTGTNSDTQTKTQTPATTTTTQPAQTDTSTPTVTNTEVQTPQGQGNVESVQLGDVTGTVCDC